MKISEIVRRVVWSALVLLMLPTGSAAQDVFVDDFSAGIDPEFWTVVSNQPLFTVNTSGGGVFLSKPYGGNGWGHWDYVFLCFTGEVAGDFSASVDFSELDVALTDVGCNAISLEPFFGGQIHAVVRQDCEVGGDMVGLWLDPPEEWIGNSNAVVEGTLTVRRSGETVTSEFTDTEDQVLWALESELNGAAVTDLCFGLGNNNSLDAVSVRLEKFTVESTTDPFVYPTEQWRKDLVASFGTSHVPNDGGGYNALGFHPDGPEAAVAYTDVDTEELKVVRAEWDGSRWIWAEPQVVAPDGRAVDLGYDSCGHIWLSYLSGGNKRAAVKIAHWDGLSWSEREIDRGAKRWMTSLAHDLPGCGFPSITYGVDSGNEGQLRFAEGDLPPVVVDSGASGEGVVMPPASGVGSFSSLIYTPDGTPAVAYSYIDSSGYRSIKYAVRDASGWNPELVYDYSDRIIREISLAYHDGVPMTAFTDASAAPLTFCEREDSWACSQLHPGPFGDPNVVVDDLGNVIVGANKHGARRSLYPELWLYRGPPTERGWHVERVLGFSAGDAAIDPNGNPAFCYRQGAEIYFAYLDEKCDSDQDCEDGNSCTDDTCQEGTCEHQPVADGVSCDGGFCCSGQCTTPICAIDDHCDDDDQCTHDSCVIGETPCQSYCEHESDPTIPGCQCIPTHSKEKGPRCSDGIDNDCDGLTDGDDPDC